MNHATLPDISSKKDFINYKRKYEQNHRNKTLQPYHTYLERGGIITYRKKIFKTYSRDLSDSLVKDLNFELLAVTTNGTGSRPKYTLHGVEERFGKQQLQAIADGVLRPMGYRDNDEDIVRIQKEAKEYV